MELGFSVFNPMLTMAMPTSGRFSHKTWMECCLPWVEQADILYRLPGHSRGADMEVAHATKHGITIVLTTEELVEIIKAHEFEAHKSNHK
tara:strand:+ start:31965 stop:32234 length:270 start_codon:yes stop_codon:yes gene_type:complete